jgi:hypothetical protein
MPPTAITILNGFNVISIGNAFPGANQKGGLMLTGANENFTSIGIIRADGIGVAPPGQAHSMQDSPNPSTISLGLGGGGFNTNLRLIARSNNGQLINVDGGLFVGQGWQIVCWLYDWTTFTGKLIWGGNTFTGTNNLMDAWQFTNPASVYYIGSNYNIAPFYPWDGLIGEFVEYSGIKTNPEINQLGNYFALKYGLTWTAI